MVISETVLVPCTITVSPKPFIFTATSIGLVTIRPDSRITHTVVRLFSCFISLNTWFTLSRHVSNSSS